MRIPGAAERRAILLEHHREHAQPRPHRQLKQLGPGIDEEIDEGQMSLRGIGLVRLYDCARLLHGGSFL